MYSENVTQLGIIQQPMNCGLITYAPLGKGYIRTCGIPLYYYQENQSAEEKRQFAEDVLNQASKIYIEPFEPYSVADFIGRVEFLYK